MTDVHYKIRYIDNNNVKKDKYVTLSPTPFGSSRVEQIWDHCIKHNIHPERTIILENATVSSRKTLLQAYKEWLLNMTY